MKISNCSTMFLQYLRVILEQAGFVQLTLATFLMDGSPPDWEFNDLDIQ